MDIEKVHVLQQLRLNCYLNFLTAHVLSFVIFLFSHTFNFSDVPWAHGQKFILPVLWQQPLNAGGLCLGEDGEGEEEREREGFSWLANITIKLI